MGNKVAQVAVLCVNPNQKNSRALFARVGRSYTRLTVEQAEAWAVTRAVCAHIWVSVTMKMR